jgi:serine/threonine-protein kinase
LQARGYLQDYDKVENLDSAITVFNQALDLDPNFALAYAGLGEAYWQKYAASKDARWVASAREACGRALRSDAKLAAAHVCLGRIESGTGEREKAAVEFEHAVEIEPTSDDAYRGLADAYEDLGKPAEAEKTYRRAIELRPRYWVLYSALGKFYDRQARYAEAASMFSQVIALAPDSIRGYYDLGAMYIYQGRYAEAIGMFQRSIAIRPTAGAYSNLGSAYFYLRRYYEADSAYGEAEAQPE